MSYSSVNFLVFVFFTACAYFLFPVKKYQWTVLLAASYIFYLFAGYKYAVFIVLTTVSVWAAALWIDKIAAHAKTALQQHKSDWDKNQKKTFKNRVKTKNRLVITLIVVLNLGILAFLKYYNFFAGSLNSLFRAGNIPLEAPSLKLFLPLGISFYTFQSIGYVVDVYRQKVTAERNLCKVALFTSFFPQIIQGPISFYDQLAGQLYEPHHFDFNRLRHGGELILWGFFKKLVIADRAIIAINAVLDNYYGYSGFTLTFTVLLYALQLYADFSGGIDISRGVAQILGIELTQNFKRPYFATTISDYWRRWHISLGAWMKEYVFYPLALSKAFTGFSKKLKATKFGAGKAGSHIAKVLPTSFASLIVFFLVGVWHGANWKYVAFGLWNGGVIMASTLLEPVFQGITARLRINVKALWFRLFQMVRTFIIVFVGYVFDVAANFTDAMHTFRAMLFDQNPIGDLSTVDTDNLSFMELFLMDVLGLNAVDYLLLGLGSLILLTVSILQERHPDTSLRVMLDRKPFIVRYSLLLVGIMLLLTFGIYGPGYDPAEFVYMQF